VDQDGFPHVVAMGFLARDGAIYMTSYGKAQKVLNVRRNPRVAVMIEAGERYSDFHGVMIRGRCEVIEDPAQVEMVIREAARKADGAEPRPNPGALARASKRVVLRVTPEKVASWDHRKLGGAY